MMFVKHALMAGIGVVFIGYLARTVGVAAWGEYQAALALVAMATVAAGIGVRSYAAREIAGRPELGPRYLGSALLIRGGSAAALLAMAVGLSLAFGLRMDATLLIVVATSHLFGCLYTTIWLSFEAHERFQYILYTDTGARLFVIALSCALLQLGYGIVAMALAYMLGNAVELALSVYFLRKRLYMPRFDMRPKDLWRISRKAIVLGIFGMLAGAMQQIDRVMLRVLGDEKAVGIFSAAFILSENLNVIADMFMGAAFASGMRLFPRDKGGFERLFRSLPVTAALLGLPVAAGVCLLGPDIITLVYRKEEFSAAAGVLRILAWQLPIVFMFRAITLPLLAARRETAVTKILVGALLWDMLANVVLIPHFRATGAAWATVTALLGSLAAAAFMSARWLRLVDIPRIAMIVLATVLMSVVAFVVRSALGMWAAAAAGAAAYTLCLFVFRVITVRTIAGLLRPASESETAPRAQPSCAGTSD